MLAIRSRLDILGLGPGLACWSVASVLGNRVSILAMEDKWNHFYEKNRKLFGLRHKLASVPNVGIAPDPVHLFKGKEEKMNNALKEIGEAAIRNDGADVLVLGSTTMHQATAFLNSALPVPVLSPGRTGVRVAEILLEMGVTQSKVAFPSPSQPRDSEIFAPHKEPSTAAR
jgi:allantoin racemase